MWVQADKTVRVWAVRLQGPFRHCAEDAVRFYNEIKDPVLLWFRVWGCVGLRA